MLCSECCTSYLPLSSSSATRIALVSGLVLLVIAVLSHTGYLPATGHGVALSMFVLAGALLMGVVVYSVYSRCKASMQQEEIIYSDTQTNWHGNNSTTQASTDRDQSLIYDSGSQTALQFSHPSEFHSEGFEEFSTSQNILLEPAMQTDQVRLTTFYMQDDHLLIEGRELPGSPQCIHPPCQKFGSLNLEALICEGASFQNQIPVPIINQYGQGERSNCYPSLTIRLPSRFICNFPLWVRNQAPDLGNIDPYFLLFVERQGLDTPQRNFATHFLVLPDYDPQLKWSEKTISAAVL